MELTISITRRKVNNTIIENFIIAPVHPYVVDIKRKPARIINRFINRKSIANKYPLLYIHKNDYNTTFVMEFTDRPIDFKMSEIYKFKYYPVLGEKRCTKCEALKIFNNNFYCRIKSKKLNKNSWYKCQEWRENTQIDII